jgi:hypothetical protein
MIEHWRQKTGNEVGDLKSVHAESFPLDRG